MWIRGYVALTFGLLGKEVVASACLPRFGSRAGQSARSGCSYGKRTWVAKQLSELGGRAKRDPRKVPRGQGAPSGQVFWLRRSREWPAHGGPEISGWGKEGKETRSSSACSRRLYAEANYVGLEADSGSPHITARHTHTLTKQLCRCIVVKMWLPIVCAHWPGLKRSAISQYMSMSLGTDTDKHGCLTPSAF